MYVLFEISLFNTRFTLDGWATSCDHVPFQSEAKLDPTLDLLQPRSELEDWGFIQAKA
jgi:hypothetical protein